MDEDLVIKNINGKSFQTMGLSNFLIRALHKKGYKLPTPIQKKCIPLLIKGKDVVGMSRTGSGKSGAFVIPMIEKLKCHSVKVGVRAIVLSPSRELATQTLKYCKEMAKYTDLRFCLLVGGDKMEDQFAFLANNPDVIIATPGRLMHIMVETKIDFKLVNYLVFDEADRLFEMGFAEQLREIMFKMPPSVQTVLFSATLPKSLVQFAKAGLKDPCLVRLDVDCKISDALEMAFFSIKPAYRDAALLYLLRNVIPLNEMTIIFAATKHHVEYLHEMLKKLNIDNTYIYGSLDQEARKNAIQDFRNGKMKILIVTDVAARGIDIPFLDNVINYDFSDKSKVFVHRVGRVARNGRPGKTYSLICPDDMPFLIDLQMFLSRKLLFIGSKDQVDQNYDYTKDIIFGEIPQQLLDTENEYIRKVLSEDASINNLKNVTLNAYKLYYRTRGTVASEAYQKAKELSSLNIAPHPWLSKLLNNEELERVDILKSLKNFRPAETIFEATKKTHQDAANLLMKTRRSQVDNRIKNFTMKAQEIVQRMNQVENRPTLEMADHDDLKQFKDDQFYLRYQPKDANTEKGYSVTGNSFMEQASKSVLDFTGGDETEGMMKQQQKLKWDKKKKRYVKEAIGADNKKRIRTESGALIPASYKSKAFDEWSKKHQISMQKTGEEEVKLDRSLFQRKKFRHNNVKSELKTKEQIHKSRKEKEKLRMRNGRPSKKGPK